MGVQICLFFSFCAAFQDKDYYIILSLSSRRWSYETRFTTSRGDILVPKMESHTAEGLGSSHLSETSAKVGYVGFA